MGLLALLLFFGGAMDRINCFRGGGGSPVEEASVTDLTPITESGSLYNVTEWPWCHHLPTSLAIPLLSEAHAGLRCLNVLS